MKSKQPYIPLYTGDYLKDTRVLPLAVRGAWIDLMVFMWDNPVRGELVGTIDEFARMMSCTPEEAGFALNLLKQKKTAEIILLETGEWKIESRKMKRDHEISEKRSLAGKNGVQARFAQANASSIDKAKIKQNTDNDIEYDNDTGLEDRGLGKGEPSGLPPGFEDWWKVIFDDKTMYAYNRDFKTKDVDEQLKLFKLKVTNDFERYRGRDSGGLRSAFQYQLSNAKDKNDDKRTTTKTANGVKQFSGKDYSQPL